MCSWWNEWDLFPIETQSIKGEKKATGSSDVHYTVAIIIFYFVAF